MCGLLSLDGGGLFLFLKVGRAVELADAKEIVAMLANPVTGALVEPVLRLRNLLDEVSAQTASDSIPEARRP